MDVGIGLPNPIPGTPGRLLVDWARRAEERGFSRLATIDRIAYPSHESLIALGAAAAVTERIGLMTNILIAPTRNPVLLAKQAATVDQISEGRLTLGLAVGGREDDYPLAGQSFEDRGARHDQDLEIMHRAWRGEYLTEGERAVTPTPVRGDSIPIMVGGHGEATLRRVVKWGIGWTAGGGAAEGGAAFIEEVRSAWKQAGREGDPRFVALGYFALGDRTEESRAYLRDYYEFLGQWVDAIASSAISTTDAVKETIDNFSAAGFDEFIFVPTVADIDQVDLLADAVR